MTMYTEGEYFEGGEQFSDFDELAERWKQYLNVNLHTFNMITSNHFGTGCVCDLKTIFLNKNFDPEYAMSLMPRVSDCATECMYGEYVLHLEKFLMKYTNLYGAQMSISDLGGEEQYFYNIFEQVAKDFAVFNLWDLWRTDPSTTVFEGL